MVSFQFFFSMTKNKCHRDMWVMMRTSALAAAKSPVALWVVAITSLNLALYQASVSWEETKTRGIDRIDWFVLNEMIHRMTIGWLSVYWSYHPMNQLLLDGLTDASIFAKVHTWVLVASMMASYSPLMSRRARANSLEKAEAKASDPRSMDIRAFTFSSYMFVRKAISSSFVWE